MEQSGIPLMRRRHVLISILRDCSQNSLYDAGKQAHAAALTSGYVSDSLVSTNLIDMYAKCGRIEYARYVFDKMPTRNIVPWAALMSGYLKLDNAKASLMLFKEMGNSDLLHNEYTLSMNMKACGILCDLKSGKQIHAVCCKSDLGWTPPVANSIIDMYFKCRRVDEAERIFDEMPFKSLISWNAMIAGYAQFEGSYKKALNLLGLLQERGEKPDDFTFSSALKACRGVGGVKEGKQIHAFLIRQGYSISAHKVLAGALVDLYAQHGCLFEARAVFGGMKEKSSISWTALILGYARRGCLAEAMDLFRRLRQSSTCVDSIVLTSIISFFASSKNLEVGKQLHCYTIKAPSNLQISVANSILDMYIECRLIEEAVKFFSEMVVKNVVSYTTMIGGYGSHGRVKEAVQLFKKMQAEEIKPDPVTYWVVLSTCGQSGLVDARECFTALCNDGRVDPAFRRYALEFDGLGRGGVLREAKNIMEKMTGNMKSFASSLLAA